MIANFAGQSLGARDVLSHAVAPESPAWTPQMAYAASEEIVLYFSDFVHSGRSWFEFPRADINFVDGVLGYTYGDTDDVGRPGVSARRYRGDRQAGFFGLADFLAVSSFDRRTSPSRRGRWIAGSLLCAETSASSAEACRSSTSTIPASNRRSSTFARPSTPHRANPRCAGCHALFDAYGLALEQFGRHR